MKKARVIIASMVIVAAIGGAFAFKAQRNLTRLYKPASPGGACTVTTSEFLSITDNTLALKAEYSTTTTSGTCSTYVTAAD